jgi:hypothetical protein
MLYREIIAVCSEIHTKHINILCGQNVEFVNVKPGGTYEYSKHNVSVIKTSQLMLYREIIAVFSEIHTKHINTLCGQKVEFVNVKPGGTYSNHIVVKGLSARIVKPDIKNVVSVGDLFCLHVKYG